MTRCTSGNIGICLLRPHLLWWRADNEGEQARPRPFKKPRTSSTPKPECGTERSPENPDTSTQVKDRQDILMRNAEVPPVSGVGEGPQPGDPWAQIVRGEARGDASAGTQVDLGCEKTLDDNSAGGGQQGPPKIIINNSGIHINFMFPDQPVQADNPPISGSPAGLGGQEIQGERK
jgi:hypothetical protein